MTKIRAIVADDEPLARRGIRQLLEPHPDIDIVAEARNGRETVIRLRELKPDLLFLDVQMPELDGFDVLREVGVKHLPSVIFVTAHDEFAVHAKPGRMRSVPPAVAGGSSHIYPSATADGTDLIAPSEA